MAMGIYAIENTSNGKIYIGSAKNTDDRKKCHFEKLGGGVHPNKHLQASFSKYGRASFVYRVLEDIADSNQLLQREQYWMDLARHEEAELYNHRRIAASNLGLRQSADTIEKRRKTNASRGFDYGRGKPKSTETKLKIAATKIGKPHPRRGDHYKTFCQDGHKKTLYPNGRMRCKQCRRIGMVFYRTLDKYIKRGG